MHTHRRIHRTEKDTHRILNTEDIIQFLHVLDKDLAKEFFFGKIFPSKLMLCEFIWIFVSGVANSNNYTKQKSCL